MPESSEHIRLVKCITEHIRKRYKDISGLVVLSDLSTDNSGDKPPQIGGFVPDVFAVDAPRTTTLLGEAKTGADLLTEHSRRQFEAFLTYLFYATNGTLIVAVPWQAVASARIVIASAKRQLAIDCSKVQVILLDGMSMSN